MNRTKLIIPLIALPLCSCSGSRFPQRDCSRYRRLLYDTAAVDADPGINVSFVKNNNKI